MAARRSKAGYDGMIAGLYDLEETIGRGHFAVVKLARHVFTGEKVAVKVIDKTKLDEISRSHLFQEVRCMKLVQHPNVVRLYEVIDTQTKLYLILELGDGGDMYDYIMKHTGGLEEKLAKRYFRQIVEAISYCHKLHVVHRDLKPENVVFFEKLGLVKLTDFGFSNMFAPGKKLETSCGSLAYSAPEILLGDSYDAPAVDVWSLGVILFMLVVGEAPFQEANDSETLTMIMDCRYHVPPHISEKCKELIGKMLQREPIHRASLAHIMAHPWLNDGDLTPVSTFMPLITKEMISDEDHSYVVEKMVEGNIATRDEILSSIEKDSYDHITATYYLLIERRLRKHQQHEHQLQRQPSGGSLRKQSTPSPSRSAKPHLEPLMLSPRKQKEMKKTKTAPLTALSSQPPPSLYEHVPALLISPPVVESSISPGSYFVKTLTTSMTLGRKKSDKGGNTRTVSGCVVSPRSHHQTLSTPGRKLKVEEKKAASIEPPSNLIIKNVLMSKSDPGSGFGKEPAAPVSKVAVLKSFFEKKAKQAADGERGVQFSATKLTGRNHPLHLVQELGAEGADPGTSQYVQSLVSPPGTHPSTSTVRQIQSTPSPTDTKLLGHSGPVLRKCSLIKEESFDEYDDEEDDDCDMETGTIKPVKSFESLEDIGGGSHVSFTSPLPTLPTPPTTSVEPVNPRRPLKSVCSSPQLLNQIHEENESEDDDLVPLKIPMPRRYVGSSGRHRENSSASPEILRKYEQRKKRRGAGQRGTSCSSSDASDTDDTEGRSRKDKLRHKFIHRRDSSDHSSDTDGPGGSLGGNGRLRGGGGGASQGSYAHNGSGGSSSGGGGSKEEKKDNSDNKNQSSNNKNSSNNHKNSRYHSLNGAGSNNKNSLTDSSLKLLSRKLSDISTGVGALLTDCRGSDCDNDSTPRKTPSTPCSPDRHGSIGSGSLHRPSRNTSLRSNSSNHSGLISESALFVLSEAHPVPFTRLNSSPVQYLGRSPEVSCCHCQPLEFSEISDCGVEGDSIHSVAKCRKVSKVSQCRNSDLTCGVLHCKPASGSGSVLPVESKCCSVV